MLLRGRGRPRETLLIRGEVELSRKITSEFDSRKWASIIFQHAFLQFSFWTSPVRSRQLAISELKFSQVSFLVLMHRLGLRHD